MLDDLLTRIDELGGHDASPVVPLKLFFEGNDDLGSFAPNLDPHPGLSKVYDVLRSIEERPDVSAVIVQIDEVLEPPEWPYAPLVYVITSADADEVHEWARELEPDEPVGDGNVGWFAGAAPPGAPPVPDGFQPIVLHWD